MLAQQAGGFQRLAGLAGLAGGFQADAQRQGAACGALGHVFQPLQGTIGIAVFQRPAGRVQLGAFADFLGLGGGDLGGGLQRQRQVFVAPGAVLQGLGAFGGHQVGQRPHLHALGEFFARAFQCGLLRQGQVGGFARAHEAPGQQVGHGVEQGGVHGTFLLLRAPAAGLVGQVQHGGQRPQRGM